MARVTVKITPMADVTMSVEGAQGESCVNLTKALEQSIGAGDGDVAREFKPEYKQTGVQQTKATARW